MLDRLPPELLVKGKFHFRWLEINLLKRYRDRENGISSINCQPSKLKHFKVLNNVDTATLLISVSEVSKFLTAFIIDFILPSRKNIYLCPDNIGNHKEASQLLHKLRHYESISRIEIWNREIKLSKISKFKQLSHLNIVGSINLKLEDFVQMMKTSHHITTLGISAEFHLVDLTEKARQDLVFLESLKRPLEHLRLCWQGKVLSRTGGLHGCGQPMSERYNQSHPVCMSKFLQLIERNGTLSFFISENNSKSEYCQLINSSESSYGCPHGPNISFLYWSRDSGYDLPGMQRLNFSFSRDDYVDQPLTVNLNQASFRNFDQINFHSSISSHLQPNALISEPLSLLTNVRLLSICDRLKSIEHIDWESLSEFQNLEALIIHEHHRLKTNASRLGQTINEILKNLAENENLAQLRTLVTPVDYQNVKSKDFTKLLSKADLEEVCFFGFARDKRDSDRLR